MTWEFDDLPSKTVLPVVGQKPRNIVMSSSLIPATQLSSINADLFNIYVSWQQPLQEDIDSPWATSYTAEIKRKDENFWQQSRTVFDLTTVFYNLPVDTYYTRVRANFLTNLFSDWEESVLPVELFYSNSVLDFTAKINSFIALEF